MIITNRGDKMAVKKREVGVIEEVSEVTSSQKFKLKDLIDKSEALGYRKFIAKGAFFGASMETEISKSEFIDTIEKFLKKRVI